MGFNPRNMQFSLVTVEIGFQVILVNLKEELVPWQNDTKSPSIRSIRKQR